jgi:hypothetical protein
MASRLAKGEQNLRPKRTKARLPAPPHPAECSASDRADLIDAYRAGWIVAWKRDAERGYRLTFADRRDEYVEVTKLTLYLEKLKGAGRPLRANSCPPPPRKGEAELMLRNRARRGQ